MNNRGRYTASNWRRLAAARWGAELCSRGDNIIPDFCSLFGTTTEIIRAIWRGSGQSGHPALQGSHDIVGRHHGWDVWAEKCREMQRKAFPSRGDFCVCEVLTPINGQWWPLFWPQNIYFLLDWVNIVIFFSPFIFFFINRAISVYFLLKIK